MQQLAEIRSPLFFYFYSLKYKVYGLRFKVRASARLPLDLKFDNRD